METLYLFIVIVLFALAISDLVVGVANDAVNFLNSAIGSKAAPFKVIMIVAALGVFVGATFSGGMMEVARKGIFHPENFYFSEIMVMFLAVMITDVILLDTFNTLGLPTSTTVSIVFELLGAAVAVSIIKIYTQPDALQMYDYINTSKALAIISGILISVVVSFTVGAVVQHFSRLLFTFDYEKNIKYFGAIFGGFAITFITYFMLIKGAKGATFMSDENIAWIEQHNTTILLYSFVAWTVLMQLMYWIFKINILKIVVLVGTFALAMAFAGNDLVNFIGVPLAGFAAFKEFMAQGISPDALKMSFLSGEVKTETYMLVIAGIVMIITLWTSRKARSVVKTSLDLSRQEEGSERFGSNRLSRAVVRLSTNLSNSFSVITPNPVRRFVARRFDSTNYQAKVAAIEDAPSFDLIRASVNLVVASILIAFATSLKLPLSTTYVTFMVAMGTSLADKAWGRDSAVYRVSGVVSVIGGWFLTAVIAFTVTFVLANIIYWGGTIAIVALIVLATFLVFRTQRIHRRMEEAQQQEALAVKGGANMEAGILKSCSLEANALIEHIGELLCKTIQGAKDEDRKDLKNALAEAMALQKRSKQFKKESFVKIKQLEENSVETGFHYIQVLDYLHESAHSLEFIVKPIAVHFDNNHKPLSDTQKDELTDLCKMMKSFLYHASRIVGDRDFQKMEALLAEQQNIMAQLKTFNKNQIKRLKKAQDGTKASMLYINTLQEVKGLLLNIINLVKAQRDFVGMK